MTSKKRDLTRKLLAAAVTGDVTAAQEAIASGASPDSRDREHSEPAILLAAMLQRREVVRLLIQHGADVNARDEQRQTALMLSEVIAAEDLIQAGADVNARDASGETALMKAVTRADRDLTRLLIAHGAEPGIQDNTGESAADRATQMGLTDIAAVLGLPNLPHQQ